MGQIVEYFFISIVQIVILVLINRTTWGSRYISIFIVIAVILNIISLIYHLRMASTDFSIHKIKKNTQPPAKSTQLKENTLDILDKSAFDTTVFYAKFENGIVYCVSKYNTYKIGTYSLSQEENEVEVYNNDNHRIGTVSFYRGKPCLIFLYDHREFRHDKSHLSLLAAEVRGSIIMAKPSGEVIAEFNGDSVGAAAAFICMYYEVSNSGPYHDFYCS